jgi:mannose-6-phosphate isomerase-like protein (cupin superfamily)
MKGIDMLKKINLDEVMQELDDPYKPRTLAVVNDKVWVQLSLHRGEFPLGLHYHEADDELFICIKGEVEIRTDGNPIHLRERELVHVKAGQVHCPNATSDCYLIRIKTVPHMESIVWQNGPAEPDKNKP